MQPHNIAINTIALNYITKNLNIVKISRHFHQLINLLQKQSYKLNHRLIIRQIRQENIPALA